MDGQSQHARDGGREHVPGLDSMLVIVYGLKGFFSLQTLSSHSVSTFDDSRSVVVGSNSDGIYVVFRFLRSALIPSVISFTGLTISDLTSV